MGNSDKNSSEKDILTEPVTASTEPTTDKKEDNYAYDGQDESPSSPGMKRMKKEDDGGLISTCDRATNVLAVGLLVMIAVASIVSIVAGSLQLASLSGKAFHKFPLFFALGVAPVVLGCICLVLVIIVFVFISFFAMGLGKYGMCCYGASRGRGALRVGLLGVFPFVVFCALVAMSTLGFAFYSISQSLPQLDKDVIEVAGLSGPIEIVRDVNGLTHIKASSRRDAFVGQGFAEAQDRLFQLEFHRMVAQGKLASLVGKDGLETDKSIRVLNVRDAAISMCDATPAEEYDSLEAFAQGVNIFLSSSKKRPVEFFFIGSKALQFHNPKPFTALDICLTARLYMWQMSSNVANEGSRFSAWASTSRSYADMEDMYWKFDDDKNTVLTTEQVIAIITENDPSLDAAGVETFMKSNAVAEVTSRTIEAQLYDNLLARLRAMIQQGAVSQSRAAASVVSPQAIVNDAVVRVMQDRFYQQRDSNVFAYSFIDASNAWAARSENGETIVASDPHLTTNLPSVWYYTHLSFPSDTKMQYDIAGVGLVGLPGVHIGKTTTHAWGITMSKTDLQDLFILPPQLLSGLPDRTYRYANETRVFSRRVERIHVKGEKDTVLNVDDTVLGPIVSEMLGFPSMLQVALYATALRLGDNESVHALMAMTDPTVRTAPELMERLLRLHAPGFSIPIGDIHGNLAYAVTGRHPLRSMGHTGKYPTVAFDGVGLMRAIAAAGNPADLPGLVAITRPFLQRSEWSTYASEDPAVPDKRVPVTYNPHASIPFDSTAAHISACNQKITVQGYPYILGNDYADTFRGARLQELLNTNAAQLNDLETHRKIQMDTQSNLWANGFRAVVASDAFQNLIKDNANAKKWSERLLKWNMAAPVGSVETAFFWRWLQRLAVLPRDINKVSGQGLWNPQNGWTLPMLTNPTAVMTKSCAAEPGIGNDDSNGETPCIRFAARAFKEQAASGDGFSDKWGIDLNTLRGVHEMLEKKPIIPVFRREMPKDGDSSSLSVSGNGIVGNMLSSQAPSMRLLFDLWKDVDHVHFTLPGGNSGNPYSPYYQNMWDKYARNEYTTVVATERAWDKIDKAFKQTISE